MLLMIFVGPVTLNMIIGKCCQLWMKRLYDHFPGLVTFISLCVLVCILIEILCKNPMVILYNNGTTPLEWIFYEDYY